MRVNFTGGPGETWPPEVTHVRLWDQQVSWREIHTAPHQFDWSRLDQLMDKATGRHVTYVIAATPQWAALDPHAPHAAPWLGAGSNSLPSDLGVWDEFVLQIASRYKGRIHAYEVWNEPQLPDFLYPYTTANLNRLAEMTKRAYQIIKKVNPDAEVLAASVLPRPSSGGMRKASKYLQALKGKGWPVDGYTTHIYPEVGKGWKRWRWMQTQVRLTLTALRAPNRSNLIVSETRFGLLGPDISDAHSAQMIQHLPKVPTVWYGPSRPDLKGMPFDPESKTWKAAEGRAS